MTIGPVVAAVGRDLRAPGMPPRPGSPPRHQPLRRPEQPVHAYLDVAVPVLDDSVGVEQHGVAAAQHAGVRLVADLRQHAQQRSPPGQRRQVPLPASRCAAGGCPALSTRYAPVRQVHPQVHRGREPLGPALLQQVAVGLGKKSSGGTAPSRPPSAPDSSSARVPASTPLPETSTRARSSTVVPAVRGLDLVHPGDDEVAGHPRVVRRAQLDLDAPPGAAAAAPRPAPAAAPAGPAGSGPAGPAGPRAGPAAAPARRRPRRRWRRPAPSRWRAPTPRAAVTSTMSTRAAPSSSRNSRSGRAEPAEQHRNGQHGRRPQLLREGQRTRARARRRARPGPPSRRRRRAAAATGSGRRRDVPTDSSTMTARTVASRGVH